jgi:hypothetical protein
MVRYEKSNKEIDDLVIGSLGIVAFISFFVVVAIQTALNLTNPLIRNTSLVLLQDNP